jgi:hypothetical protein
MAAIFEFVKNAQGIIISRCCEVCKNGSLMRGSKGIIGDALYGLDEGYFVSYSLTFQLHLNCDEGILRINNGPLLRWEETGH